MTKFLPSVFFLFSVTTQSFADPFDESSCQGPAISYERASSFFSPGESTAAVGDYTFQYRQRRCSQPGGCTEWTSVSNPFLVLSPGGENQLFNDHGTANLVYYTQIGANNDEFQLSLDGDWVDSSISTQRGRMKTYFSNCIGRHHGVDYLRTSLVGGDHVECSGFQQELQPQTGGPSNRVVGIGFSSNDGGRGANFKGVMTDSCLQLISKSGRVTQSPASVWIEKEAAILIFY